MYKRLPKLGFTLIELLVVIAIIGILAVALFAAINPIEQVNKTRDTGHRSDATEINKALERFYTNNQCYPWNWTAAAGCAAPQTILAATTMAVAADPAATSIFSKLVAQNEIKPEFQTRMFADTALTLSSTDPLAVNGFLTHVSFVPASQAYKSKANFLAADNICATPGAAGVAGNRVCTPGTNF